MQAPESVDVTLEVTSPHHPKEFGEQYGLPASAFQIGETIHILRSTVQQPDSRGADLTVEEALGIEFVAD